VFPRPLSDSLASSASRHKCDVLIVGGGPAGLSAAIAIRQRGLDVAVVDAQIPPIEKGCGEGLMPEALEYLERLGVRLHGGRRFSGIVFAQQNDAHEQHAEARFSTGAGVGIRRSELQRQLIRHAEKAGVFMKWGSPVNLREYGSGEVQAGAQSFRYRYLVGADGEASAVRRWASLDAGWVRTQRIGFRRHYRIAPWSEFVEVHWCDLGQAYVTPVGEDEICVAAITRKRGIKLDSILEQLPRLHARLGNQFAMGRDRGARTSTRRLRRVTRGHVALIGDASGSADAITGSGLASAFHEAHLLAESLAAGDLAAYEHGHKAILSRPQAIASLLVSMDNAPRWRDHVFRVLSANPELFARLLDVHTGMESLAHCASTKGTSFALQICVSGLRSFASHRPTALRTSQRSA
jgi:menaquinone-9 beta-reductase